jgi:hypothetical protein
MTKKEFDALSLEEKREVYRKFHEAVATGNKVMFAENRFPAVVITDESFGLPTDSVKELLKRRQRDDHSHLTNWREILHPDSMVESWSKIVDVHCNTHHIIDVLVPFEVKMEFHAQDAGADDFLFEQAENKSNEPKNADS